MIKRKSYLPNHKMIKHHVALYGAGTQSTGMILMAMEGKLNGHLDFGVFADTGGEPSHVTDYKEYFADYVHDRFGFDIVTVQKSNLEDDINDYIDGKTKRVAQIPLRSETGLLMRQCTMEYKIIPSDKYIKNHYKIRRKNDDQDGIIGLWMGISIDEMQRMKISQQWWKQIVYPLVEVGYRREDTINYVKRHGLKEPPRSACYFCPFHSNNYWQYLYDNYPDDFQRAVEFDEKIRRYPKLDNEMYLHKQIKPLGDIDFTNDNLFDLSEECDGYCGI